MKRPDIFGAPARLKGGIDGSAESAHRRFGPPFSYDGLFPQLATEAPLARGFFAARALMKSAPTRRVGSPCHNAKTGVDAS
jgi:hypothetical protein